MSRKLSLLIVCLVSLFAVIPARADSVYVTAWQVVFNQNQGSMTFCRFDAGSGLGGAGTSGPESFRHRLLGVCAAISN